MGYEFETIREQCLHHEAVFVLGGISASSRLNVVFIAAHPLGRLRIQRADLEESKLVGKPDVLV